MALVVEDYKYILAIISCVVGIISGQEFQFKASCGGSPLVTSSSCDSVRNKIDELINALSSGELCNGSESQCINRTSLHAIDLKLDLLSRLPPPSYILGSCGEIRNHWPNSPSGYYTVSTANGETSPMYCHMEELCGTQGPWSRIGFLNMSDPTHQCPTGFSVYSSNGIKACGRSGSNSGCTATRYFSPPSKGYSQVCGRIIGYQYASTDAFVHTSRSIDQPYLDGVSITRGSPRKHIWSFASGFYENVANPNNCPCSTGGPGQSVPSFVGDDYFCESGNPGSSYSLKLYHTDPLWDGKGCGSLEKECCKAASLPWFHKTLSHSSTDYLEMRICAYEAPNNDDTPISLYELYVK